MAHAKFRWLRFALKGLGVLIGILALAFLVATYLFARTSSTRSGPLRANTSEYLDGLIAELPEFYSSSDDEIRFLARRTLSRDMFTLVIAQQGESAHGSVTLLGDESGEVLTREFPIPSAVYVKMMTDFDSKIDGYWGRTFGFTDGTSVAFERKRAGQIVSGFGNSPCHYDVLTNILVRDLAVYVPELLQMAEPQSEAYAQSEHCDHFLWIS